MAFSFTTLVGDGATTDFLIPCPYLSASDIGVKVNGSVTAFTFPDSTHARVSPAPAIGASVEVRRTTPKASLLTIFQDGSVLGKTDLNNEATQLFYIVQEAFDASTSALLFTAANIFDALSQRISNLADPLLAQDAATKAYVDRLSVATGNVPAPGATNPGFLKALSTTTWGWITSAQTLIDIGGKGAQSDRTIYSNSGTFTKASLPAWVTHVRVRVWGAGGGGGGGNNVSNWRGTGGGGGGYAEKIIAVSALGTSETVTIGAAGPGGAVGNPGANGTAGGTSSFGAFVSATGGSGGLGAASATQGGVGGGTGSGGDLNLTGSGSQVSPLASASLGVSSGGSGAMGGGGGGQNVSAAGISPGGGGSCGNHTSGSGGAGASGLIIVEW